MKTIAIVLAFIVTASCAVDTSTTEQHYCTQEDIDNGTCADPGGGSTPDSVQQAAEGYTNSIVLANGFTVTGPIESFGCMADVFGHMACHIGIRLGGDWWLFTTCTDTDTHTVSCESCVRAPTQTVGCTPLPPL